MTTVVGGLMSTLVVIIASAFAYLKLEHLRLRKNPSVSAFTESIDGQLYDVSQDDFQIAIGIDHWFEGVKNDARFLKWIVHFYDQTDADNLPPIEYPMH